MTAFVLMSALTAAAGESAESPPAVVDEEQLESLLEAPEISTNPSRRYTEEDFAPYFADEAATLAKRAYDRKDYRTARKLFPSDAAPTRYLRAMSAFYLRLPEAADELRALGDEYPALRDRCLLFAGRATERLRQPQAAEALYEAVSPGSSVYAEARFALAQVLARNHREVEAVAALQPLRELTPGRRNDAVRRQALLSVIHIERTRRDYPAEYRAMVELWATSPKSPEARQLWERIRTQPLPNTWRLRRAESYLAFNENHEATRLANQVKAQLPSEDGCRARFILGNVLRKERRHRAAVAMLLPVVGSCTQPELHAQALYVMGYSQSIVDKVAAAQTYETLAHNYPTHAFADDALFFAAELHAQLGEPEAALKLLSDLVQQYPTGNFAAEALFKTAWLQRESGLISQAVATLTQLEKQPTASGNDRSRANYWRARLLEPSDAAAAGKLFAALVEAEPTSWYGVLARERLPDDGPLLDEDSAKKDGALVACGVSPESSEVGPLASDPHFLTGVELLRLGLREARNEFLLVDRRTLGEEPAWLLMDLLRRADQSRGAALVARSVVGQHLRGAITSCTAKVWEAIYPLRFRPLVVQNARPAKLDPDLLQALMREESSFNRRARSSTGAIGLAQLMPGTAQALAQKLNLGAVTEEALMNPALNIRLGGAYLGSLVMEFGSIPYAVAAYNAGPHRVRSWVVARAGRDLDAWVEEIPFAETRNYVMRVLGSYGAYRLIYGRGTSLALEKPEKLAQRNPAGPALPVR